MPDYIITFYVDGDDVDDDLVLCEAAVEAVSSSAALQQARKLSERVYLKRRQFTEVEFEAEYLDFYVMEYDPMARLTRCKAITAELLR